MRPDQPHDEFEIDLTPIWPDEDGRLEPIFLPGPLWIDFEEFDPVEILPALETAAAIDDGPALIGFDEIGLGVEPDASEPPPAGPPEASLWARRRASSTSLLGSFAVHLLTLLVLIGWSAAPAQMPGAIPVRLVLEAAAAPVNDAPPGDAVAEASGEAPKTEEAAPAAAPPPPTDPAPTPEPPRKLAAASPPPRQAPPKPKPAAAPAPASPRPAPPPPRTAAPPPPPPSSPLPPSAPARAPVTAPPAPAAAPVQLAAAQPRPGTTTTAAAQTASAGGGGDYLNQLVVMTRGHLDILPLSFLAGRRGRATLSVLVIEDGTIGRISVKHSSGYPDIDARIEQMVAAVGRFPPVPASLPRPSVELDFDMSFPDAMQQ